MITADGSQYRPAVPLAADSKLWCPVLAGGGWVVQVSGTFVGTRRSTDPGRPWVTAS